MIETYECYEREPKAINVRRQSVYVSTEQSNSQPSEIEKDEHNIVCMKTLCVCQKQSEKIFTRFSCFPLSNSEAKASFPFTLLF